MCAMWMRDNLFPKKELPSMPALKVDSVDFQVRANRKLHHTKQFELTHHHPPVPVLRRGQPFLLSITFKDRPYNPDIDDVSLFFRYGGDSHPVWGTKSWVTLSNKDKFTEDKTQVDAIIKKLEGNTVHLEVISPIISPVGEWELDIWTKPSNAPDYEEEDVYHYPGKIYLLFNPWCKDDTVYMADEKLLKEYVLNHKGKIWKGDWKNNYSRSWDFGQFDGVVLEASVLILQRSGLQGVALGDPVKVSRALTKMINSNVRNGVLHGSWDNHYEDGVAPSSWTGSSQILEKYLKTGRTVKYGQCWVFSGVLTTICRALGIPARPVTNFESAHDTDKSLTVDRFYFPNNKHVSNVWGSKKNDSIWNFHVWTDAWMARPDIKEGGCDGWQAIDATPQEESDDGFYQCGPAPVAAIRRGDIGKVYDVQFVLAEVHAEVCNWMVNPKGPFQFSLISSKSNKIGKMILTKAPNKYDAKGDDDVHDVTQEYKAKKGSEEEKACTEVLKNAKKALTGTSGQEHDMEFEMQELEQANMGDDIRVGITIKNKSTKTPRYVNAVLTADAIFYNGKKGNHIKTKNEKVTVYGATEFVEFDLPQSVYMDKLVEYAGIQFYAIMTVEDTNQIWVDEQTLSLGKPQLSVIVNEELHKGQPTKATFTFTNNLKRPLTNCKFHYEGTGLCSRQNVEFRDIAPKEQASLEVTITPEYEGEHMLSVAFESEELIDVHGSALVKVVE